MIFKKPEDVSYTDMCVYIDRTIKRGDITEEEASLIYEYLFHIIYMLAINQRYFHKEEYYNEFAILTAGDVFNRLVMNPKLNEYNEDGTPKLDKIKSCLNYIKAILHGRKIAYEQSNYSQKFIDIEQIDSDFMPVTTAYAYTRESTDFTLNLHLNIYFESISKTIKSYLKHNSPYRKDKLLMKNIYMSCLLSILNSLTFTASDVQNMKMKYVSSDAKTRYIDKIYARNRNNCITLYHLSSKYRNYITVLVRQLFTLMGKDIQEMCHSNINIPEDVLMSISLSEVLKRSPYDN